MADRSVRVGPFTKGLNTQSDPSSIADEELVVCENFELDLDGSLVSRPPYVDRGTDLPLGETGYPSIVGIYTQGETQYIIASDGDSKTYYYTGSGWALITDTFSATSMAQYDNKAWMTSGVDAPNPGGSWTPDGGFVADEDMPRGDIIVSHKFRLWVAAGQFATSNGTRLYYSKILGQPDFWKSPDFLDVGAGDGQNIVNILSQYDTLLVFRTDSVYGFSYSSDPSAGSVKPVILGVGLAHKDALAAFESYLYFIYNDRAYEFINNRATQVNIKVPFAARSVANVYQNYAVTIFNKRVLFHYYDTVYAFNLMTRTWSTWVTDTFSAIGRCVEYSDIGDDFEVIGFSSVTVPPGAERSAKVLSVLDNATPDRSENFRCTALTKNFNYDAGSQYKRLFWWGADALFKGSIVGTATPITYKRQITWGEILTKTWDDLRDFTWGQPQSGTQEIVTDRDALATGANRYFSKFKKSLRFRQINYKVVFETDGSSDTAPVRLFNLMTYVRGKEQVVKAIS